MLKDNLVMLRNINRLSQETVAEKIGISRQAYAKWETGATVPDIEKCRKLADIYGVTLDSLADSGSTDDTGNMIPSPRGKNIWGTASLNERGQIVIPKALRDKFGLSGGSRLVILSDDNEGIAMIPAEMFEERMLIIREFASQDADKEK